MIFQRFDPNEWAAQSAALVQHAVQAAGHRQAGVTVMLTGGRSAEQMYEAWNKLPEFHDLSTVRFFFGDERCVPPGDPDSNYGLAMRSLFARGGPPSCLVHRMEAEDPDREAACFRYERCLPGKIDVLLLGVGEDGHIASLFPGSWALDERVRSVVPVVGAKEPRERLTVTPSVIEGATRVFVLANGEAKAAVLKRVSAGTEDFHLLPACLVSKATWLLDTPI